MYLWIPPVLRNSSVFHHKYAVKDYSKDDRTGYALNGSANWCSSTFIHNYEDIVFTSNFSVVEAFHNDFEQSSAFIDNLNTTNEDNIDKLNKFFTK